MYLVINNSLTETTTVDVPKEAEVYALDAAELRSTVIRLNGSEMTEEMTENMLPVKQKAGELAVTPGSCVFIVI